MKTIGLPLLLFTAMGHAAPLSDAKMNAIAANLDQFKKDCPALAETKEISALEIKNKTSESIDKVELAAIMQKQLALPTKADSAYALAAVVATSSSESKGVKKENLQLTVTLTKAPSELCKKSYSTLLTEIRKPTQK